MTGHGLHMGVKQKSLLGGVPARESKRPPNFWANDIYLHLANIIVIHQRSQIPPSPKHKHKDAMQVSSVLTA
jgi:hypothetical protein